MRIKCHSINITIFIIECRFNCEPNQAGRKKIWPEHMFHHRWIGPQIRLLYKRLKSRGATIFGSLDLTSAHCFSIAVAVAVVVVVWDEREKEKKMLHDICLQIEDLGMEQTFFEFLIAFKSSKRTFYFTVPNLTLYRGLILMRRKTDVKSI